MIRISKLTDYSIVLLSHLASAPEWSKRGAHGGYRLARDPDKISIADVITALEGPIGLTQCSSHADTCGLESICPTKAPWRKINDAVLRALRDLSLAEMAQGRGPAKE